MRYVVRAYDLAQRRLLPQAIVDKREPDERMRGYAVARATSPGGAWVYTLYTKTPGSSVAFVHALNAAGRSAFCVDLPAWATGEDIWNARLELSGNALAVREGSGALFARIDTRTLKVSAAAPAVTRLGLSLLYAVGAFPIRAQCPLNEKCMEFFVEPADELPQPQPTEANARTTAGLTIPLRRRERFMYERSGLVAPSSRSRRRGSPRG